jgi:endonuclease YncB( thermonuclease family)
MSDHKRRTVSPESRAAQIRRKITSVLIMAVIAGGVLVIVELLPRPTISGHMLVVDGDSLRVRDDMDDLRLYGIDAPELTQLCRDRRKETYPCGERAKSHLERLIAGRAIECTVEDVDRYGRSVSICKSGNTNLNFQMVTDGWAVAYREHDSLYADAEAGAQERGAGLWQGQFDKPRLWRKLKQQKMISGESSTE